MRSKSTFIGILLGLFSVGMIIASSPSQSVKHHPNPNSPLKERWKWAEKESKASKTYLYISRRLCNNLLMKKTFSINAFRILSRRG